jgi:hypothetical protein
MIQSFYPRTASYKGDALQRIPDVLHPLSASLPYDIGPDARLGHAHSFTLFDIGAHSRNEACARRILAIIGNLLKEWEKAKI